MDKCLVEATQILHRFGEAELTLHIEIQQAVTGRQTEIEQRHMTEQRGIELIVLVRWHLRRPDRLVGMRAHDHLLPELREMRGERAAPHTDARAEQHHEAPVTLRRDDTGRWRLIDHPANDVERLLGRRVHIDKIVDPGANGRLHAIGPHHRAHRDQRQFGRHALEHVREFDGAGEATVVGVVGMAGRFAGKIEQHDLRIEIANALLQLRRTARLLQHHALFAQRRREPLTVARMRAAKEEAMQLCHGVQYSRRCVHLCTPDFPAPRLSPLRRSIRPSYPRRRYFEKPGSSLSLATPIK
ncbi:hypothetical protein [Pandoraea soli]